MASLRRIVCSAAVGALTACSLFVDLDGLADRKGEDLDRSDATREAAAIDAAEDVSAPELPLGCGAADAGLAAYFPLDEGAGTRVLDCSGNGLSGTINPDGGWGTREGQPALSLESTSVSLGTPNPLKLEGAITLAAFVWVGALAAEERPAIMSKMGSALRGWELAITNQDRGRRAVLRISPDNEEEVEVFTAQPIPFGQWVHLAGTFSPGVAMRIYVDGKLSNENAAVALGLKDSTAQAVIGGRSYAYPWRGLIDDVRIYSRALSEAEIAAIAKPR